MSFYISDKKFVVMGAGRSGVSASKLLLEKSAQVVLFDDKHENELRYFSKDDFTFFKNFSTAFGPNAIPKLDCDYVVISPGISLKHPLIIKALEKNIPILGEIDLALQFLDSVKIIGVTGTNGKSTTTVMIESIFKEAGFNVKACGNLGLPLSQIAQKNDYEVLVLELSSFQLESMSNKALKAAVILNITKDHLDRYSSFEQYRDAKMRIISLLADDGLLVINKGLNQKQKSNRMKCFLASDYGCNSLDFLRNAHIFGEHNRENAVAASLIAKEFGISDDTIVRGLNAFKPLPHRCEIIAYKNGITFVNDSKGTTVEAVKKALSMLNGPTHLLLGGIEKGEDFSELSEQLFPQIKNFYVYGRDAKKILNELNTIKAMPCKDLAEAVRMAGGSAKINDVVLLSPGCASYDQFDNYEHRGQVFRQLVETL